MRTALQIVLDRHPADSHFRFAGEHVYRAGNVEREFPECSEEECAEIRATRLALAVLHLLNALR